MTAAPEPSALPDNPLIEALRAALTAQNGTAEPTFADYTAIVNAASDIVAEYDRQLAYISWAMSHPYPSADQIRAQLGLPVNQNAP